ncbi:MAG: hypothetical protein ACYCOO_04740 [Chitinophagaceae bacterium]
MGRFLMNKCYFFDGNFRDDYFLVTWNHPSGEISFLIIFQVSFPGGKIIYLPPLHQAVFRLAWNGLLSYRTGVQPKGENISLFPNPFLPLPPIGEITIQTIGFTPIYTLIINWLSNVRSA